MLDSLAVFNRAADRRGERGRDRVRQLRGGEEPGVLHLGSMVEEKNYQSLAMNQCSEESVTHRV